MGFSSAVPTDPPSIWPTVTVAEASPASWGATPNVPVLITDAITIPRPTPARMMGPSTPVAYPVPAPSGLGPNLGISTIVDRLDARMRPALIGRNATPVTSGE